MTTTTSRDYRYTAVQAVAIMLTVMVVVFLAGSALFLSLV